MYSRTNLKTWLVILVVLLVVLPGSVRATGTYDDGDGSAGNPFQINTAAQMDEIGQHSEDWDKCFILVNDVNMAGYTGEEFNIIGTDHYNLFSGVFDGNDHTISNFTYTSTGVSYIGLFGCAGTGGEIKDLGLLNVNIDAGTGDYVGGLVGYNDGTVSNCYATGSVTGRDFVGGLVGAIEGTVSNCYATGTVTGDGDVGGLVGYDESGSYTSCFWDSDVNPTLTGIGNMTDPAEVMGRTTAEMKTLSTFVSAEWDFGTPIWVYYTNGYPRLAWESTLPMGDLNHDGRVDWQDFAIFADNWLAGGFN